MCVVTQTPLLQFTTFPDRAAKPASPAAVRLTDLVEGRDYRYSPGGVTRIVYPLLRRMIREGLVSEAHWISLNPSGPLTVEADRITLHHVSLGQARMEGYGKVKEVIWGAVHGTGDQRSNPELMFWSEQFPEYAFYNRLCAELLGRLDAEHDFDLFYIHDFQLLPLGRMLSTLKPKVFRWHIPFDGGTLPAEWKAPLVDYLQGYDLVIVSTRRYLESLREFGYAGKSQLLYPYIDPEDYSRPSKAEVAAASARFGLRPRDRVALVVARMDPMKGQDRAIAAVGRLAPRFPQLKLVLVGNGSFSSSDQGVGLSKGARWRAELEEKIAASGLHDRVVLAGHVPQGELDALYQRAAFTILPSLREGFGLVVVESWLHRRAAIVSARAGIAELVEDGKNGLLYDPEDSELLARRMARLLEHPEEAIALGKAGHATARRCFLDEGLKTEAHLLGDLIGE